MKRVAPDKWRPSGIPDLEPAAWAALRHPGSAVVIAGPGAGKTEFLAQRAAYLLQTGLCPSPHRILAVSFKKDAAQNLADRVAKRCTVEQAARLTSMTFDAFTKGLLDRFITTVPAIRRPTRPYELVFRNRNYCADFIARVLTDAPSKWQAEVASIKADQLEPKYVGGWRLPVERHMPLSGAEFAITHWWQEHMPDGQPSSLTFVLLNRLAEFIVRHNTHIASALRMTYPFVFLDEFQDITYAQYDFLLSAFQGSNAVLTAVGDRKQSIMRWAGAREDSFERIVTDFGAETFALTINHRSSRELVRIQHVVARALDNKSAEMDSYKESTVSGDAAQIWTFKDPDNEAPQIARWVQQELEARPLHPRDFAILVKQKAESYERQLTPSFAKQGLRIRNEAKQIGKTTLQDLLADDLARAASAVLRLAVQARAPTAWETARRTLFALRDVAGRDEAEARHVENELTKFVQTLGDKLKGQNPSVDAATTIGHEILTFLDLAAARRAYPQYAQGDDLEIASEAFVMHLGSSARQSASWLEVVDAFDGVDQVPLMTVHKSKGLEYDTVIFVGLNDDAWWAHNPGDKEGLSTFFVALSRAKQRAIFTYAGGGRSRVKELYDLLKRTGVQEVEY